MWLLCATSPRAACVEWNLARGKLRRHAEKKAAPLGLSAARGPLARPLARSRARLARELWPFVVSVVHQVTRTHTRRMALFAVLGLAAHGLHMQSATRLPASRMLRAFSRMRGGALSMAEITLEETGEFGTTDFSMTFKTGGEVMSPWHDAPLELEGGLYNMLTEIPKMTLKKMEVDTKAPGNPIKQDEKKGKARLYHGPIFWNYGCLPQTWEDPNVKGDAEVGGAFGDDDPVDVVEIGAASLAMGSFTPVKVLGCLSMIDDGELDWKVGTRHAYACERLTPPANSLRTHAHTAHTHAHTRSHAHTAHTHARTHATPASRERRASRRGRACARVASTRAQAHCHVWSSHRPHCPPLALGHPPFA